MISIKMNDISRSLGNIEKQTNYGVVIGLNKLAEHIRISEMKAAKSNFTLRGKWYQPKNRYGFNIKFASKKLPEAMVYTRADWLEKHTEGGIKTAKGDIAMPTQYAKRSKSDIIKVRDRPRNVKDSAKRTIKGRKAIVKYYDTGSGRKLVVHNSLTPFNSSLC